MQQDVVMEKNRAEEKGIAVSRSFQALLCAFFLMLLLSLPIYVVAEPLLRLWLVTVPPYTLIFLQLIVIQSLFSTLDTCFYTGLYACGRVKVNALVSPLILALQFPAIYVAFKLGCSPVFLSYAGIAMALLLAIVVKPIMLIKLANYTWEDIKNVLVPCGKTTVVAFVPSLLLVHVLTDNYWQYGILVILVIIIVLLSVFYVGIDKVQRTKVIKLIKK